jgi:hypothetical protein
MRYQYCISNLIAQSREPLPFYQRPTPWGSWYLHLGTMTFDLRTCSLNTGLRWRCGRTIEPIDVMLWAYTKMKRVVQRLCRNLADLFQDVIRMRFTSHPWAPAPESPATLEFLSFDGKFIALHKAVKFLPSCVQLSIIFGHTQWLIGVHSGSSFLKRPTPLQITLYHSSAWAGCQIFTVSRLQVNSALC